jgi:hypothetical protein
MPIGLMTGAPGESRFLLEDASDFKIFLNFSSPTLRIRVRIVRVVETESYLFLGKRIITPSPATSIKLGTTVLIASRCFSLFPSHFPLPSPFTAPWLTPLLVPLLLSLFRQPTLMTQGMTPGGEAPRWPPLLLQLVAPQKWWRGKSRNSLTSLRR